MLRRTRLVALATPALVVLLVLPLRRLSSAEVASMAIRLVVQESCEIHSDSTLDTAVQPVVACMHGQPFHIERGDVDPIAESDTPPGAPAQALSSATLSGQPRRQAWIVTF